MRRARQVRKTSTASGDLPGRAKLETVVETLRARIRAGRYAPEHRLVEADLTRELLVSRGVVREALRRLTAEDLVVIMPHRGASVRGLSRAEAGELFDVLEGLAVTTTRLAAQRIDAGANRQVAQAALETARVFAKGNHLAILEYVEANARFHDLLSDLAGNRKLAKIRSLLQVQLFRLMLAGLSVRSEGDSWISGHEEILVSILTGDPNAADEATRAYARNIRGLILSLPDSAFAGQSQD